MTEEILNKAKDLQERIKELEQHQERIRQRVANRDIRLQLEDLEGRHICSLMTHYLIISPKKILENYLDTVEKEIERLKELFENL
jgi:DNA repair exonuclease SbcCD ATPase subunit